MSAATGPDAKWRDGITAVHTEAGGVLDIVLIDADAAMDLIVGTVTGSHKATLLLKAVTEASARIRHAPRRFPALCVCCPRTVKRVTADIIFGAAVPATTNPRTAVAFAFCSKCSADRPGLPAKATAGLQRIWPGLRPFTVTHPAGGSA